MQLCDMKATEYCYDCLRKLACQAAELGANNEQVKARAVKESLKILHDNFSLDCVSIVTATKMHDLIKDITGNPDPYLPMKDREIRCFGKHDRFLQAPGRNNKGDERAGEFCDRRCRTVRGQTKRRF